MKIQIVLVNRSLVKCLHIYRIKLEMNKYHKETDKQYRKYHVTNKNIPNKRRKKYVVEEKN